MPSYFTIIPDPRNPSYVKHKLCDILYIIMCAVLSGLDELCTIYAYAQSKAEFFRKQLGIERIPSKPTFCRILKMLDGKTVVNNILEFMKEELVENKEEEEEEEEEEEGKDKEVIAVDGKAIRSTSEKGKPHSALQILSAYSTTTGIVLAQEKIRDKTNEIPVFQEMLSYLDIKGKTITADALHCQKETCKKIIKAEGKYVIGLKENQKKLYQDVSQYFQDPDLRSTTESSMTVEKNKGRLEKRICYKLTDLDWLEEKGEWPGLTSVLAVERIITTGTETTRETSYYISSANLSASRFLEVVRAHWQIESMHWILDVVFSEDDCHLSSEDAHLILNAYRKCAVAMHKKYISSHSKKCSIKGNMFNCLLDDSVLLEVIRTS